VKIHTTLTLALCVALLGPGAASASDGVTSIYKHRIQMHQAMHGTFNLAATALAPPFAMVPAATSPRADVDKLDGLNRHRSDCNFGCIDY
jgi:hypothetical protein